MTKPAVTVLIDTYNHERFIAEAITSVLTQDFPPSEMEILVVDDGSTDAAPDIIRKFAPRVRHLRKPNGGQASAFNAGIPEAQGEIVAFLDGDDWWASQKLSRVMEAFQRNSNVGVVGHGIIEVHENSGEEHTVAPKEGRLILFDRTESATTFSRCRCFFGTSRVALKKSVLEKILPIPHALVIEADEWMSTVGTAASHALLLQEALTFYRLHSENLFQFLTADSAKLRKKAQVMDFLSRDLPGRLKGLGVYEDCIRIIVEPAWVEGEQLRLAAGGGRPWETFRVERAVFRRAYSDSSLGYQIFKGLALGTTLILPPRRFYQLQRWYASSRLRQLRRLLGEPIPAAPIAKF